MATQLSGAQELAVLHDAGFSTEELEAHVSGVNEVLTQGGFTPDEIAAHWGKPVFNNEAMLKAAADFAESVPTEIRDNVGIVEAWRLGYQGSVGIPGFPGSLLARERLPEAVIDPETATMAESLAFGAAAVVGDLPAMFLGGLIGGGAGTGAGPVGAAAVGAGAAFALPAAIRSVAMDRYANGEATTFGEVWERFSGALIETAKGYGLGVATGGAGAVAKIGVAPLAARAAATQSALLRRTLKAGVFTVPYSAEVAALTTVGAAIEGEFPTAHDAIHNAILVLGLKSVRPAFKGGRDLIALSSRADVNAMAGKLRRIFVRTNRRPQEVLEDLKRDESILEDLHDPSKEVPRAYEDLAAQDLDPRLSRAAEILAGKEEATLRDLQRGLKVSRGEASGMMDALQDVGIVGPEITPTGPRPVLVPDATAARARVRARGDELAKIATRRAQDDAEGTTRDPGAAKTEAQEAAQASVDALSAELTKVSGLLKAFKKRKVADLEEAGHLERQKLQQPRSNPDLPATKADLLRSLEAKQESLRGQRDEAEAATREPEVAAKPPAEPPEKPPVETGAEPPPLSEPPPPKTSLDVSHGAIRARIGSTKDSLLTRLGRFFNFRDLTTDTVNQLHPLRKVVKMLNEGTEPEAIDNAATLAQMLMATSAKAQHFLEQGPFDFHTYERLGRGLAQILSPFDNDATGLARWETYAISKRVVGLDRRGIKHGMPSEAAREIVAAHDAEWAPILKEAMQFQEHTLKYLKDSGVVSGAEFDAIVEGSLDFVPFHRVFTSAEQTGKSGAVAVGGVRNPIFKIQGNERQIHSPLESIVKNNYLYIQLAEKNAMLDTLFRQIEGSERGAEVATKVKARVRPIRLDKREKTKLLKRFVEGAELNEKQTADLEAALAEDVTIFRPEALAPKGNQISFFRDGKRQTWEFKDKELAAVFTSMNRESMNLFLKIFFAPPARLLRSGAILAPQFIARNPARDTMIAYIQSETGFKPVRDTLIGLLALTGKTRIWEDWRKSGGPMAELTALDARYLQEDIVRLSNTTGLVRRMRNVVTSPFATLRFLSQSAEAATRIGEFGRAISDRPGRETVAEIAANVRGRFAGVPKEDRRLPARRQPTKAEILKGGGFSREVSLDFGRIGARMQAINQIIPFVNAQFQGMSKMLRTMKEHPVRTTARAVAALTVPSIILRLTNEGEQGFDELPQWQKDMSWVYPIAQFDELGDPVLHPVTGEQINTWIRIPKPFTFGMIFATLPERAIDFALSQDLEAFDGALDALIRGAAPSMIPQVALPFLEHHANKSFFTDRPIIPIDRERLLPEMQYSPYTTSLARQIGLLVAHLPWGMSETDLPLLGPLKRSPLASPSTIENVVRQWSGGLGVLVMNLADQGLTAAGIIPDVRNPDDRISPTPFISAFQIRHPSAGAQPIVDFYEEYERNREIIDSLKAAKRDKNVEAIVRLQREYSGKTIDVDRVRKSLARMSRTIRSLDENPRIETDQKAQLIERIYFQMIEVAKRGNEIFDRSRRSREERALRNIEGRREPLDREQAAAALRAAGGTL